MALEDSTHDDAPVVAQPLSLEQKVARALEHGERASRLRPMAVIRPQDPRRLDVTRGIRAATEDWLNNGL